MLRTLVRPFSSTARTNQDVASILFSSVKGSEKAPVMEDTNVVQPNTLRGSNKKGRVDEAVIKYILNCRFTKNNTHFTYSAVMEDRNFLANNPQLSYNEKYLYYLKLPQQVKFHLSTGHLGFRKAARGEYEASFQTATKLFETLYQKKLLDKNIEIVMRDFGKGRDAFISALNGKEGNLIRRHISRVADATELKFGGVKAPRPRRL